jgi:hypothetical protein
LIERYNDEVPKLLSDIHTDVTSQAPGTTVAFIIGVLQRKANIMSGKYGLNYWYGIAYERIANEPAYIASLLV